MEAVRVPQSASSPDSSSSSSQYSVSNPAPSSALALEYDVPIPRPRLPNEMLVRVRATTVVRDTLTWPETYRLKHRIPGNDFSGTVVSVHDSVPDEEDGQAQKSSPFKPGDEVYGMTAADRAGTWAQYAIVSTEEVCLKPPSLSWTTAAAVPLSALTAYQALFDKAGITPPDLKNASSESQQGEAATAPAQHCHRKRILITGATGCVGLYIVQLASLSGLHVVAATRSQENNAEFLQGLGADEVVEYKDLTPSTSERFQYIIDTVGGETLKTCWTLLMDDDETGTGTDMGTLISVDSASYDFVEQHRKAGVDADKSEKIKAQFFIVSPSKTGLEYISTALELGLVEPFVARVLPLKDIGDAYEHHSDTANRSERGKIVLMPWPAEDGTGDS